MAILVCKVIAARDHEAADRLRVYTVEATGVEPTQIIANRDTVYEVGDVVAAALIGTTLQDGTKIEKSKIRGVLSFGMLLGKRVEATGTDITAEMGATHTEKVVDESQGVVDESAWPRYTSLDSFLRVRREILAVPDVVISEKLHGSNFRAGFSGNRPYMVGTHTSRVVDSRLDPTTWPGGHLIRKALEWSEGEGMDIRGRVAKWRVRHPEVKSLAVYGEVCGYKCSDLHYGSLEESEVRLFGEVAVDGRFLDYDDAIDLLTEFFDQSVGNLMVPVLYRGKPSLDVLKRLRDEPSRLAASRGVAQISEGIVIRPTTEVISTVTMNRLTAKYKSPLYEERKSLRDKDPATLPTYVTAYDLLADFVTEERVRHVIAKASASGMVIEKRRMKDLGGLLYEDIRKESVGEWPGESLDEGTLRRWTFDLAGEMLSKVIDAKASQGGE